MARGFCARLGVTISNSEVEFGVARIATDRSHSGLVLAYSNAHTTHTNEGTLMNNGWAVPTPGPASREQRPEQACSRTPALSKTPHVCTTWTWSNNEAIYRRGWVG